MNPVDVKKYLESDEKILWQGRQTKKSTTHIAKPIIIAAVLLVLFIAMISILNTFSVGDNIVAVVIPMTVIGVALIFTVYYMLAFIPRMIYIPYAEYVITDKSVIRIMGYRVDIRKYNKRTSPVIYKNNDGTGSVLFDEFTVYNLIDKKGKKRFTKRYLSYVGMDKDFFAIENIPDYEAVMALLSRYIKK